MFNVLIFNPENTLLERLNNVAVSKFHCHGILENQLEEVEVDNILAEESYCGGDVPDHVLKKLESLSISNPIYYFESQSDAVKFSNWARETFLLKCTIDEEEYRDWNQEWKKHYQPILLGQNFWIVPSWQKAPEGNHHIMINPGQGFGTGSHPTTCGCLEALLHYQELLRSQSNSVLDFGCGSGILGISFLKLMNGNVDFCDIDQNALDNCLENIKLNNLDPLNYSLTKRQNFAPRPYNIIFANILLNVLLEESATIQSCLTIGGLLFLSGILDDQVEELLEHYQKLFSFKEEMRLGREKWITLVLRRL
ncbi:MAG: 50S ribosomal protein L11 methyltransferase [Bdellovibrio sp.]|nr:50S ribosomal protein L11 methyltransferase [Bdellovibrio sp.]